MQTQRTFAFETTLRQDFAIRMAQEAKATGFDTDLHFIAAPVEVHIERVTGRALAGGHAASEPRLREMYAASMNNLPLAIAAFDYCSIYDSTQEDTLRIELRSGQIVMAKLPLPVWLPADLSLR